MILSTKTGTTTGFADHLPGGGTAGERGTSRVRRANRREPTVERESLRWPSVCPRLVEEFVGPTKSVAEYETKEQLK